MTTQNPDATIPSWIPPTPAFAKIDDKFQELLEQLNALQHEVRLATAYIRPAQKWGDHEMTLRDLEVIAEICGTNLIGLMHHPDDIVSARRLSDAKDILDSVPPYAAEKWLALGRKLRKKSAAGESL